MEKRFALFLAIAFCILLADQLLTNLFFPPPPKPKVAQKKLNDQKKGPDAKAVAAKNGEKAPGDAAQQPDQPAAKIEAEAPAAAPPAIAPRWVMLGSADPDPKNPYRMLVTLTNAGAAVERIELNSPRYRDIEDRSGYLGRLVEANVPKLGGCLVQAVGEGTPAELAGIEPGDIIKSLDGKPIASADGLVSALKVTKPRQKIELSVERAGKTLKLAATLGWRPIDVIHPELKSKPLDWVQPGKHDPFSLLVTLQQVGDSVLEEKLEEFIGVDLRKGNWEVVSADQTAAVFRRQLPKQGLEFIKRFRLAQIPKGATPDSEAAYHLVFTVEVRNIGTKATKMAYRLDGPNGLPIEGAWYASKVSRDWSAAGLRDVLARFVGGKPQQVSCYQIADEKFTDKWKNTPFYYLAVDAQYFGAALIPRTKTPDELWFDEALPIRVGDVPANSGQKNLTNVSFRLLSKPVDLAPGEALVHELQFFAGPKKPDLLAHYGTPPGTLEDLVYYGWFYWVAVPMLRLLHVFYALVHNYGIAIVMLTVLVRMCMYPLSRRQALSAAKMQELQPEIKRLNELYKGKSQMEARAQAQRELFRKHNYNPLGGCLLVFVQFPIFVGLYKSLMVDVELRQAPLISDAVRWCSNLAAPDQLYDWSWFMPNVVNDGVGFFGLGPYLNLFPLITIALFIWQQKMFMPPATDEQTAIQQKMMQYMMIFMGFMFFKVASGLCLYFIASSLWGIAERKLLPKPAGPASSAPAGNAAARDARGNGASGNKKKLRERK